MSADKPFFNYPELVDLLIERGLTVNDRAFAEHVLMHHNYYRVSAYRFPFQQDVDTFVEGTTIEDLWTLYDFDRKLRAIITEACKTLEISVRARWAHVLGERHGERAYEDSSVFRVPSHFTAHLSSLDQQLNRSHEPFVEHYQQRYGTRPPIWAACEAMSFGLLSRFYENLNQRGTQKKIASTYSLSPTTLESLLTHATYIRNICAHHSRLWNRSFVVTLTLPTSKPSQIISSLHPEEDRKLYNTLLLLGHITKVVNPDSSWTARLYQHLFTLPRPDHSEMGFPVNWQERDFWQDAVS